MKSTDNNNELNINHVLSKNSLIVPSRRLFLQTVGLGAVALGLQQVACKVPQSVQKTSVSTASIQGFEESALDSDTYKNWIPVSDRKIKVGIVGYGASRWGGAFSFQNHPNVEIVAVSDLIPERRETLAKVCKVTKTYPSLGELIKDKSIEAVFVATDAPSHARHAIEVLKSGKHVAVAVPAVFGSLEEADELLKAVKVGGKKYMMFETSCFHEDLYAMRQIYKAGGFGKLIFSEGEYYHYAAKMAASYKDWRIGLPPQWYGTHSNAYYICVTDGSFTEVSCLGMPSLLPDLQPGANRYNNRFFSEIAMFRTSEGGMSRMAVSWDTPGDKGEKGRIRGEKASFYDKFEGLEPININTKRPPLPPTVLQGGHGGSHGYLTNEFINSILEDRKPIVDIISALNLSVPGIVAHESALKDGELLKIPQYK
jgi:predicted dehydrogenase